MKKLIVILMLIAVSASARIDESKQQCAKRYGKPWKAADDMAVYRKAGFDISIVFKNGKCVVIIFNKIEKNALDYSVKITDVEFKALLKANGQNKKWTKISTDFGTETLMISDGSILAIKKTYPEHNLIIMTKKYMDASNAIKDGKEKRNIGGF